MAADRRGASDSGGLARVEASKTRRRAPLVVSSVPARPLRLVADFMTSPDVRL